MAESKGKHKKAAGGVRAGKEAAQHGILMLRKQNAQRAEETHLSKAWRECFDFPEWLRY